MMDEKTSLLCPFAVEFPIGESCTGLGPGGRLAGYLARRWIHIGNRQMEKVNLPLKCWRGLATLTDSQNKWFYQDGLLIGMIISKGLIAFLECSKP